MMSKIEMWWEEMEMSSRMGQSRLCGTHFPHLFINSTQDLLGMTKMGVLCLLAEGSSYSSLSCSLTNSFKTVNFGSIMSHCSTLMSLSKNKERAIGSGTRFPEGSGHAMAFRIGGVPLGQCASVREEHLRDPVCHGSWYCQRRHNHWWSVLPPYPLIYLTPKDCMGHLPLLENLGCHLCPSSVPGGPQYGCSSVLPSTDRGAGSKDEEIQGLLFLWWFWCLPQCPQVPSLPAHKDMGEGGKTSSIKNTLGVSLLSGGAEGCPV